jgi:acetolactate synthase I/II/III large subunit
MTSPSPVTGADLLVEALIGHGVRTVFGLPGVQLDPAFDALARRSGRIRVYQTRNEQATSHMADGYARASGELGCCLVVPGPGVLNAATGLATAYACCSPVLCVAGHIRSDRIDGGLGLLHEIPHQGAVLHSVAKWVGTAVRPEAVPGLVAEAVRQMRTGRPRPAAVQVPPDVLSAAAEGPAESTARAAGQVASQAAGEPTPDAAVAATVPPDGRGLEEMAARLHAAERPLVMAGGGVLAAAAWAELAALAERLNAPVVLSSNAKGALSARHPLAFEAQAAPELLERADVILAVGTRFAPNSGERWRLQPGQVLVRIDADPDELSRAVRPAVAVAADARQALDQLADLLPARPTTAWPGLEALRERARAAAASLEPQASFGAAIRRALPDDAILVSGITQLGYWAWMGFPVYEPRTFLTSGYQGTLGFELPTGIGAQVARPDRRVVVVAGDGGFLFNVQELATAVQHRIPVTAVVFNDNAYGNVRRLQQQRFGRLIGSDLRNPDFVRLAGSFGMRGLRAEGPEALEAALRGSLDADGPMLIEAPVGEMADPWPLLTFRRPLPDVRSPR